MEALQTQLKMIEAELEDAHCRNRAELECEWESIHIQMKNYVQWGNEWLTWEEVNEINAIEDTRSEGEEYTETYDEADEF